MELYNGQLKDIELKTYTKRSYSKNKGHTKKVFCDDIFTFDIEVSSAWLSNGKVIPYHTGETADYWNNLTPLSLCYIWQFSYNDKVYYGREIKDFLNVLNDLPQDINIIIWVHNLSYEFHFLTNILKWKNVFARTPHKPMKATSIEYPKIEFRCSYVLTRLSLKTWGNEIGTYKDNPIDYEKIRTPLTPLTEEELHYCEQDCIVVYKGIQKYLERYGNMREIPLTQTGTVRKVVKELLMSNDVYYKFIKKLVPKTPEEYQLLQDVFAGGYTHANRYYSGRVQRGYIEHYDFASSYPTVMVAEKYPMSPWLRCSSFPGETEFEDYAFIFTLRFYNIRCETNNTYIQASKCKCFGEIKDNGRVVKAEELIMTMTEQDYLTIKETYTWEQMDLLQVYKSKKEYLPKDFVNYVLDLYKNKTELKDIEGKEEIYAQSKQYINSMFGMCVTGIIQADVVFDNNEWKMLELTYEDVQKKLDGLRTNRLREKRYFLSYSWGCWITAYARRNLWKCIEKCDTKVIYCDTDSIFVKDKQDFSWYNNEVTEKLKVACEKQGLDFEKTRPKTKKGKEKPLGIFVPEDSCSEFITLGAKRYVERRVSDNQLHLTVSGINKDAVGLLNNNIENFRDGFDFNKDADCVHKQLATYCTDMPRVTYEDGYISTYKCGINLRRTGYLLSMTEEYKELINLCEEMYMSVTDKTLTRIASSFPGETERRK